MSSTAPMQFDQPDVYNRRDQATESSPAPAVAPAQAPGAGTAQTPTAAPRAETRAAEHSALNTSWIGIVLATFALYGGLLLWTAVAVSGEYTRWVISVGVMVVILALTFVAIGYAER
jgi:hypothetical protein